MSLSPIAITFLLVALLFIAIGSASARWVTPPTNPPKWRVAVRATWVPAAAEALVLTLFATLWFGSLGHGGWLLVFLLLGALAAGGGRWHRHRLLGTPAGAELRLFAAGLVKYLLAGRLCAWCLT